MIKKRIVSKILLLVTILMLFFAQVPGAYAASTEFNSCDYKFIDLKKYGGQPFANPKSISSINGVLKADLKVQYTDKEKTQIAGCPVQLRTYNGELVGPTLRVKPNDLISINLINALPPEPLVETNSNTPHGFNTTNLHTHGLHVSPSGNSDNVLREMPPKEKDGDPDLNYSISIKLPPKHPAGTYWYHPHKHGSTALQVSSGMSGALIVEGGLDKIPTIEKAEEKIFVFQQISYDTKGEIENYKGFGFNGGGNASIWSMSGRHTTINGQIYPTITLQPGEVQRWRFIHAGVRDSLNLELRPIPTSLSRRIKTQPKFHEIAVDGIALGKIDSWQTLELEPGYRSDVLVQFPDPGIPIVQEYELVDVSTPPEKSLLGFREFEEVLAKVVIKGEPLAMQLPKDSELLAVKQEDAPSDITRIDGFEEVTFDIQSPKFMVNGKPFEKLDPNPISLKLNQADQWTLKSLIVSHPFHIHVNPFQYTRKDPNGNDEVVWRDTLLVRQGINETIKSRYTLFDGKFVLHCHILDHEDQGMMKIVEINK